MGNRTKGKTKKKSIKSKAINMNSKRKLSRFGKERKAGHSGAVATYISRTKALKKLQITLRDFRRLCILKGVYPRDPKKAPDGKSKTYYSVKDIYFLAHEPLLEKFRTFKSFMKKVRRLSSRKETYLADKLHDERPKYKLDHLVRERYPQFDDAIRDLDDALTMVNLFSRLPSEKKIGNTHPALCSKLSREWQYYVSHTHSLRHVFVSIKGIYYQAEVRGEKVTWLVPHEFTQEVPSDVDLRVMTTFLEFYEVYFKFVLYKLYNDAGLVYPPKLVESKLNAGVLLDAIEVQTITEKTAIESMNNLQESLRSNDSKRGESVEKGTVALSESRLKTLSKKIATIKDEEEEDEDEESEDEDSEEDDEEEEEEEEEEKEEGEKEIAEDEEMVQTFGTAISAASEESTLFADCNIFLSREVPRTSLEFVIKSFGGNVGWEGFESPFSGDDASVTHFIIDRPVAKEALVAGREYIQPQWIYDCVNARMILPVTRYLPGVTLPPHLSPFVDDVKEGYVPAYRQELDKLTSAVAVRDTETVDEDKVLEEEEEEIEDAEEIFTKELEAEKAGISFSAVDGKVVVNKNKIDGKRKRQEASEDDEEQMKKILMSKKQKRLHGRMMYGINKKEEAIETLKEKRRKLESK